MQKAEVVAIQQLSTQHNVIHTKTIATGESGTWIVPDVVALTVKPGFVLRVPERTQRPDGRY